MIGKGATPSFFAIANYNYTLTFLASQFIEPVALSPRNNQLNPI